MIRNKPGISFTILKILRNPKEYKQSHFVESSTDFFKKLIF